MNSVAGVLAIVQARCSSSRLPGKVLRPIAGAPMIVRQLERIARSTTIDSVVVATSDEASDDQLADELAQHGVAIRRGPLNDVFARFGMVVDELRPAHIVRLTADCPLADPDVIDAVVAEHVASGADYTSNCIERTYPHGLDAECMTSDAFARAARLALSNEEREHVTLGIYSRPVDFHLRSVTQSTDQSGLRWTVDYPEDLAFVRTVYEALYPSNPTFTTADVIDLIERQPSINRTSDDT